jgi:hypothetical protein
MSQESKGGQIADDFPSIAARLRELSSRSGQVAVRVECDGCADRGWVWSASILDWRRCPHCGMSRLLPKPRPLR